jgi:hypothetical protein
MRSAVFTGACLAIAFLAALATSQSSDNKVIESSTAEPASAPQPPKASPQPKPVDTYTDSHAQVLCRGAVRNQLKDPGSFSISLGSVESGTFADNDGEWLVKFPFRARNSFNAVTPGFAQCLVNKRTGLLTWIDIQ